MRRHPPAAFIARWLAGGKIFAISLDSKTPDKVGFSAHGRLKCNSRANRKDLTCCGGRSKEAFFMQRLQSDGPGRQNVSDSILVLIFRTCMIGNSSFECGQGRGI